MKRQRSWSSGGRGSDAELPGAAGRSGADVRCTAGSAAAPGQLAALVVGTGAQPHKRIFLMKTGGIALSWITLKGTKCRVPNSGRTVVETYFFNETGGIAPYWT